MQADIANRVDVMSIMESLLAIAILRLNLKFNPSWKDATRIFRPPSHSLNLKIFSKNIMPYPISIDLLLTDLHLNCL